jgi:hypothetical protein
VLQQASRTLSTTPCQNLSGHFLALYAAVCCRCVVLSPMLSRHIRRHSQNAVDRPTSEALVSYIIFYSLRPSCNLVSDRHANHAYASTDFCCIPAIPCSELLRVEGPALLACHPSVLAGHLVSLTTGLRRGSTPQLRLLMHYQPW